MQDQPDGGQEYTLPWSERLTQQELAEAFQKDFSKKLAHDIALTVDPNSESILRRYTIDSRSHTDLTRTNDLLSIMVWQDKKDHSVGVIRKHFLPSSKEGEFEPFGSLHCGFEGDVGSRLNDMTLTQGDFATGMSGRSYSVEATTDEASGNLADISVGVLERGFSYGFQYKGGRISEFSIYDSDGEALLETYPERTGDLNNNIDMEGKLADAYEAIPDLELGRLLIRAKEGQAMPVIDVPLGLEAKVLTDLLSPDLINDPINAKPNADNSWMNIDLIKHCGVAINGFMDFPGEINLT